MEKLFKFSNREYFGMSFHVYDTRIQESNFGIILQAK